MEAYLKFKLKELAKKFPIIGEVRRQGLFLEIELFDEYLNPLARHLLKTPLRK